jgi:hypothetical protein
VVVRGIDISRWVRTGTAEPSPQFLLGLLELLR